MVWRFSCCFGRAQLSEKDPFGAVPEDEVIPEAGPDVGLGKPNRQWRKKVPLIVGGGAVACLFAWIFLSSDEVGLQKKADRGEARPDAAVGIVQSLKEDAAPKKLPQADGRDIKMSASGSLTGVPGSIAGSDSAAVGPQPAQPGLFPNVAGANTPDSAPAVDAKESERLRKAAAIYEATASELEVSGVRTQPLSQLAAQQTGDLKDAGASTVGEDPLQAARARLEAATLQGNSELQRLQTAAQNTLSGVTRAGSPTNASPAVGLSPPNRSASANDLLASRLESGVSYNPLVVVPAAGGLTLDQGSSVRVRLSTGMNSELPGAVIAHQIEDVYDSRTGGCVLIPRGSKWIGEYSSSLVIGQSRIFTAFSRLIYPNGDWVDLRGARATDRLGANGLPAQIDEHFLKMFGSNVAVAILSLALPKTDQQVTTVASPSGVQQGGSIVGGALSSTASKILERNLVIAPTGKVAAGSVFAISIGHDLTLEESCVSRR
jgi:type IV secretion system protein TrbI